MSDHSDHSTRHFVRVAASCLSRLTDLVEAMAEDLNRPGTLRLRKNIISEARMTLVSLQAAQNSLNGFGGGDVPPTSLLRSEEHRLCALLDRPSKPAAGRAPTRRRVSTLRLVAGTDMEARP